MRRGHFFCGRRFDYMYFDVKKPVKLQISCGANLYNPLRFLREFGKFFAEKFTTETSKNGLTKPKTALRTLGDEEHFI